MTQHDPEAVTVYQQRIRVAYQRLCQRTGLPAGSWVMLTDLRPEVGGHRELVDAALRALEHAPDVVGIVPESNQKTLSQADRAAALRLGGQDKHAIAITGGQ